MKITELLESKTVKAEKPRNFVAKHAKTGGAGKMKDKSKTLPRQEKHKKPAMAEGSDHVDEANIQPTSARSRSHIGNLSNPVVNSVVHPSSGKEIGLITKQPNGEYHAHHSAAALSHAQSGTFATKDEAHQFIRNAHANAIKNGTLSNRWLKTQPSPQFAKEQGVAEGSSPNKTDLAMAYLMAVVNAPMGTPEKRRIINWQQILDYKFDIEIDTAALAQLLPQLDNQLQSGKLDKLQNRMISRGELSIESIQQGVAEGSVKELQLDLRVLSDEQFQTQYRMTKAEARAELRKSTVKETATDGSTSASHMSVGAVYKNKPPKMQKPGTNALDSDDLLTGGSLVKRR